MKALLQKDLYQLRAYCKSYLLICAVFFGISPAGEGNLFFITYPAMLCSLIPATLQTYDERGKWACFAGTLPFTRAQLVSAKYLVGLCCSGVVLLGLYTVELCRRYRAMARLAADIDAVLHGRNLSISTVSAGANPLPVAGGARVLPALYLPVRHGKGPHGLLCFHRPLLCPELRAGGRPGDLRRGCLLHRRLG